jgi:hypothetical protein
MVCVRAPSDDSYPLFGEVTRIILHEDSKLLLIQEYEVEHYSHHFSAYKVTKSNNYSLVCVTKLALHQVFHRYFHGLSSFIVIKSCSHVELFV